MRKKDEGISFYKKNENAQKIPQNVAKLRSHYQNLGILSAWSVLIFSPVLVCYISGWFKRLPVCVCVCGGMSLTASFLSNENHIVLKSCLALKWKFKSGKLEYLNCSFLKIFSCDLHSDFLISLYKASLFEHSEP